MKTHVLVYLSEAERARFRDALCLLPTNMQVTSGNAHFVRVNRLHQDISENEGAIVDDNFAGGLSREFVSPCLSGDIEFQRAELTTRL